MSCKTKRFAMKSEDPTHSEQFPGETERDKSGSRGTIIGHSRDILNWPSWTSGRVRVRARECGRGRVIAHLFRIRLLHSFCWILGTVCSQLVSVLRKLRACVSTTRVLVFASAKYVLQALRNFGNANSKVNVARWSVSVTVHHKLLGIFVETPTMCYYIPYEWTVNISAVKSSFIAQLVLNVRSFLLRPISGLSQRS